MAQDKSQQKAKKKLPTALKRMRQDEAKRQRHRAFKSRVRTAVRTFEAALSNNDQEKKAVSLQSLYSLLDKGVKVHIYKKNKAARDKSRFAALASKPSS